MHLNYYNEDDVLEHGKEMSKFFLSRRPLRVVYIFSSHVFFNSIGILLHYDLL